MRPFPPEFWLKEDIGFSLSEDVTMHTRWFLFSYLHSFFSLPAPSKKERLGIIIGLGEVFGEKLSS